MRTLIERIVPTMAAALIASSVVVGRAPANAQDAALDDKAKEAILAAQANDGGTAAAGRQTFEARCAACHRFGGVGKDVGPDLTTIVSRFKRRDVLESMLWPSKVISEQYLAEIFELKDGKVVSGLIVRENAANVFVRTADSPDKPIAVPKAQIANRAASTVSLMPDGLYDKLSPTELSDLLAFVMAPPPEK